MTAHPTRRDAAGMTITLAVKGLSAAAAALGLLAPVATAGEALPAPTGGRIGVRTTALVDSSRTDPWTHAGPRRLMVSAFYPARERTAPARWITPRLANYIGGALGVEAAPLRALRSHAGAGAPPRRGRHPVVIVAPGAGMWRGSSTTVAEDLAAHGYMALLVDHPGDGAVELPTGRVVPSNARLLGGDVTVIPKLLRVRMADTRFLLDRLPGLGRRGPLRGLLDRSRIGMVGFSLGGVTAAAVMLDDERIDVGVNYDGSYSGPVATRSPRGPFLTMTAHTEPNQTAFLARQRGPGLLVNLVGSEHEAYSDLVHLPESFPGVAIFDVGTIAPDTMRTAQMRYTRAFLARHLLGRKASPLLRPDSGATLPAATVTFGAGEPMR